MKKMSPALAAYIGRKKYGAKKFAAMGRAGKRRKAAGKPKTNRAGGGKRFAKLTGRR
tara:strand:- start:6852 stop:7022 length:171 start_codon:yes stop_codon:yes gene_type:complete